MECVLVTSDGLREPVPGLDVGSLLRWSAGEAEAVLVCFPGGWNRSEERPGLDL